MVSPPHTYNHSAPVRLTRGEESLGGIAIILTSEMLVFVDFQVHANLLQVLSSLLWGAQLDLASNVEEMWERALRCTEPRDGWI